jgi:hypothetical protein
MYFAKPVLSTLLATWVVTTAFADETAQVEADEPSAWDTLSTTLTVGYDSRYVLYGYRLNRHLWHADTWLTYPLNDKVTLNGGSWYGQLTDGTYEEVDGYAGMDYALTGSLYIGFQYSLFNYLKVPFETSGQAHELAAHISYWGEHIHLSLRNQYDNEAQGSLTRILTGYSTSLAEKMALKIDAEAGYAFGYYIDRNVWNHALVKASMPYQVDGQCTLTPFVAYTIPLAAIDAFEKEDVYFGLSVSVSF